MKFELLNRKSFFLESLIKEVTSSEKFPFSYSNFFSSFQPKFFARHWKALEICLQNYHRREVNSTNCSDQSGKLLNLQ